MYAEVCWFASLRRLTLLLTEQKVGNFLNLIQYNPIDIPRQGTNLSN